MTAQIEAITNTINGLKLDIDKFRSEKGEAQRNKTELERIVSDLKLQNDKLTQQRNLLEGQIKGLESRTRHSIISSTNVI